MVLWSKTYLAKILGVEGGWGVGGGGIPGTAKAWKEVINESSFAIVVLSHMADRDVARNFMGGGYTS